MSSSRWTFVIGIVSKDERLRETLQTLLQLEIGGDVRTASSLTDLKLQLDNDQRLLVVVGAGADLTELLDGPLLGPLVVGDLPLDASGIVNEIKSRLNLT